MLAPARRDAAEEQHREEADDAEEGEEVAHVRSVPAEPRVHEHRQRDEEDAPADVRQRDAERERAQRWMADDVHEAAPRVREQLAGVGPRRGVTQADRDPRGDGADRGRDEERVRGAQGRDERAGRRRAEDARDDVAVAVDRVRTLPEMLRDEDREERAHAGVR